MLGKNGSYALAGSFKKTQNIIKTLIMRRCALGTEGLLALTKVLLMQEKQTFNSLIEEDNPMCLLMSLMKLDLSANSFGSRLDMIIMDGQILPGLPTKNQEYAKQYRNMIKEHEQELANNP